MQMRRAKNKQQLEFLYELNFLYKFLFKFIHSKLSMNYFGEEKTKQ